MGVVMREFDEAGFIVRAVQNVPIVEGRLGFD